VKRLVFLLVGLAISVVSLFYALAGFHFNDIWDAMGRMQPGFFLLMIIPYVLTFMTKVWRWKVLLHSDDKRVTTSLLFSALMISYIPFPFRAGEVARGVVVSAKTGIPAARVFSTILVEKVLDVLTLLLLMGLALPFVTLPAALQGSATGLGLFFLAGALCLLVLVLQPDLARKLVAVVARRLPARLGPRIEVISEHALEGLTPMSDRRVATRAAVLSLATWSVNAVTIYFLMSAFNVQTSPLAAVMVMIVTNLGMAIPSAPGYIGTFELAVVLVLGVLNIPAATATTFAIVYHFIALVPVATIGAIAALQQGVGFAGLGSARARSLPTADETPANIAPAPATLPAPVARDKR
jgi:uncharacterized protein (TIRG00374 family)